MELDEVKNIIMGAGLVPHKRRKIAIKREVIQLVCAFDIETTTIFHAGKDHAIMYVWQFSIDNQQIIMGRTWDEYKQLCNAIDEACTALKEDRGLKEKPVLVVYVHNLSFEFQFLSGIFDFMPEDVFLRAERKPIYARSGSIEYRCSYIQSNMSLARFCQAMNIADKKLSGQEFDYTKKRYPWTQLSEDEIAYCKTDVISVVECIKKEMEKDNDNLITIPLTSTGYVRRECFEALTPKIRKIKCILPMLEEYELLREAFRGGNTHANRYFVGQVLENVKSKDMASCYPAQLLNQKYPYEFKQIEPDKETVLRYIGYGCAVVFRVLFKNIELRNEREPIPYISLAKTKSTGGEEKCGKGYIDLVTDNGRILSAGICQMTITEVDYEIIDRMYKWDKMTVVQAMFAEKDYIPAEMLDVVKEYYENKTKLKGLEDEDNQYFYMKAKNKLNSIYGMCATNPLQETIEYRFGEYKEVDVAENKKIQTLRKAILPYQWGVYCTAYARKALQEGIDKCGDKIVYCDTDSIKHIGDVNIDSINKSRIKIDLKRGAYADDRKGDRHYLGVYEDDGDYDQFITQGAKRYAVVSHGKLKVTVSGVTKQINEQTGKAYAAEELGQIENFKPGMIWSKAGGTRAVYNDKVDEHITIEEHDLHITKNVAIVPTTYEMEYPDDYEKMLNRISLYGRWKKEGRI